MLSSLRKIYDKHPALIAVITVVLLFIVLAYLALGFFDKDKVFGQQDLRVSKQRGGTYEIVLTKLIKYLNKHKSEIGINKIDSITSEGSVETMELLAKRAADIGLVQGDTKFDQESIRGVLELYPEVFLFFTSHDVETVTALCDSFRNGNRLLRIASLGLGSQTFLDLYRILNHYGLPKNRILHSQMKYEEIKDALLEGMVDAGFYISGIQAPIIRELAQDPGVNILSFEQREGLRENIYGVDDYELKVGALGNGQPEKQVSTIKTTALLVVNQELSTGKVYDLTKFILQHKDNIKKTMSQFEISKLSLGLGIKLHAGTERAYDDHKLNWIGRNYILIKFFGTIVAAVLGALSLCFQVWKHYTEKKSLKTSGGIIK